MKLESRIVNRQIGVGDSKYGIYGDCLFAGYVTQPIFPPKLFNHGDAY